MAHVPELWVFAYGSLMWRPDFPFVEARAARLAGYHRCFCIISRHYRGTDAHPGLVLGLDRGGVCVGRAFRVSTEDAAAVVTYLRRREQISGVYREAHVPVTLLGEAPVTRMAMTFLAEPAHPSYIRGLGLRQQAVIVGGAVGKAGSNLEYLVATLRELRSFGIREAQLERLLVMLGPLHARTGLESAGKTGRMNKTGRLKKAAGWPKRPIQRLAAVKRFTHRTLLGQRALNRLSR